jgi:hypothetical protein
MKKEKNVKLNLNINKDDSVLNDFLFCWDKFDSRPNKITIHNNYSTAEFVDSLSQYTISKNIFTEIIPSDDEDIINEKILAKISDEIYLSYVIVDKNVESSIISDVVLFYKEESNLEDINKVIEEIEKTVLDFSEEETHNINTISISNSGIDIEPVNNLKVDTDNQELYYSEKTFKSLSKMAKKIKKNDRGLCVLHGNRGTGKTAAINYIANNIDRIIIFVPNNLIDQTINNPDFRKLLKKYHKPIVILDDCEMIFNEYFAKSNTIVNNLLQLVDGFLSENITFVTIFNVDDELEIDHTLLECNNLIDVVYFSSLSVEESEELSSHLGYNKKFKQETNLVDVVKKKKSDIKSTIGF